MKLKKSYWAKILIAASSVLFYSCASVNLAVPVPGQGAVKVRNIYAEYYTIGDTYFKLEEYQKAAEYYELAMHKKSQYWAAYYKLAKCYVFTSNWNNALPMYKTILERDPDNASIKASIAYIYSMQGNFKKSVEIYEALLEEQPKNQEYLENYLAVMAGDEKRFERKYAVKFTAAYETLKEEYPENKNLNTFEEKYKKLMKIKDELPEEGDDSELDEDEEESAEETGEGTELSEAGTDSEADSKSPAASNN